MTLLGKLNWAAIPLDQPIVVGTVACVGIVILAVLAWITAKDTGHIYGANGSHPSIISGSASCISRLRCSCLCVASQMRS